MPQSKVRHKHPHQHHPQTPPTAKHGPKRSAARILAICIAFMGALIAFFIHGAAPVWIAGGLIAGLITGYLIGHSIDKAIANK